MCFSTKCKLTAVQNQIDEYTNFIDVVYYFWVLTNKILQKLINPREKQIIRILSILQRVPIPSENELIDVEEEVLFCFTKSAYKLMSCIKLFSNYKYLFIWFLNFYG